MDLGIRGRTALVCAASKGLGRACAFSLAREGVLAVLTVGFGVAVVLLAETTTAYLLLAILVGAIGLTWLVQMVHHSGILGSGPVPTH